MLAATAVDVAPLECEMRPYMSVLYADPAKKARVNLPLGSTLRKCGAPEEGSQVLTVPDSGGTEVCVFYEFGVNAKDDGVQATKRRMGVSKSLADKKCPAIDYGRQSYPGRAYMFLDENVQLPLANAFAVKAKVETAGLAFLNEEKKRRPDKASIDYGTSPLSVGAITVAASADCIKNAGFFQGRYLACYRAEFYNQTVRGGWNLLVALNKKGEYVLIESERNLKAAQAARAIK